MVIIRKEQMEVFEEDARQNFEDEMVEHIKHFSPAHCESIGDDAVREVVKDGIQRAEAYGFTNRGPVRFFIETIFLLGSYFDTDPQYPWAAKILNDIEITDQMERSNLLYEKVVDYMERVMGPDNEYANAAYTQFLNFELGKLPKLDLQYDNAEDYFNHDILDYLAFLYPKKVIYTNEDAIKKLIQEALEVAEENFSVADWSASLFTLMMFFWGHDCFNDRQFPWISNILDDELEYDEKAASLCLSIKDHITQVALK